MRYQKALIAGGAAMFAIAISGLAVGAKSIQPMAATKTRAAQLAERLDQTVKEALAKGCADQNGAAQNPQCADSRERVSRLNDEAAQADDELKARPPALRATAEKNIRKFRGRDGLAVNYLATSSNPYRDDGARIETYVDDEANEYWIDPGDDHLVQVGPHAGGDQAPHKVGPENRLPVSELRQQALRLIEAADPVFAARRSSLHPLEDNKGKQVYFFRWDDFSAPLKESEMPPFIQVGLYADGRLASFTDTLNK